MKVLATVRTLYYIVIYCSTRSKLRYTKQLFFIYIIYCILRRDVSRERELCYIIGILDRHLLYVNEYYFVPTGKLLIKTMAQSDRDSYYRRHNIILS